MCMITYLRPGVWSDSIADGIWNGTTWNNDGHGWAIAAGIENMLTGKSMNAEEALEGFRLARAAFPEAPALFHSRLATHGTVNEYNVHPFNVGRHAVVAHNGILPVAFHPGKKDMRSDTHIMADEWLVRQSRFGTWSHKERSIIGELIGTSNKLCILSVSPKLSRPRGFLVNGHMGEYTTEGAWYSNHDFEYEYTPKQSAWMGEYYIGGGKRGRYHAMNDDDQCPWCYSSDTVNWVSNVCSFCHTCIDCMEHITDCLCYMPHNQLEAAKHAEEDQDSEEASIEAMIHSAETITLHNGELFGEEHKS